MEEITSATNLDHNLASAMRTAGIGPPGEIIADGKIHRFTTAGDRLGSNSAWYILYPDEPQAGAFGSWKRGISETWTAKNSDTMTPEDRAAYLKRIKEIKAQRQAEQERMHAETRRRAVEIWEQAETPNPEHPYLVAKQIKAYGIKQAGENLIVPVRGKGGVLQGIQFISPAASKKFLTGTAVAGCYLPIGKPNSKILIAEGYATGATLHAVTGHAVAVAFNAGNLKPVAEVLRAKLPETTLLFCADDDWQTPGNPGITKATEAAQAVGGLLAVPTFPANRGAKDTDFNDLFRLSGAAAVKDCLEGAKPVDATTETDKEDNKLTFEVTIQRLAALSPLEYDQVRKAEAKKLEVRFTILDSLVKAARKAKKDTDAAPFPEVDPWPEPVDPERLLYDIAATVRRFIVCSPEIADAVALWTAFTWFIDVVSIAPLAVITAPEKRCGKSLLLSIIGMLSARPIIASSITPAALFRSIDTWKPTLIIDEADAFMRDNEELRGLLNSGHTRDSAYVIRTVGDTFTPTKFNTWGAKCLAGIGKVADTLMDRAIILELRRKLPEETVDRVRYAEPNLFIDLRAKLARFAEDYSEQVKEARPPLPYSLNDRAQDNWEALLAIALTAGDEWLQIGTRAALKLSGGESAAQTIGVELLSDIQEIFETRDIDRISTVELIKALCEDDEKPWSTYNKGYQIKPRQIAIRLKSYGIISKSVRSGFEVYKGFEIGQFTEAFCRYIPSEKNIVPSTPENCGYKLQTAPALDLSVTDRKNVIVTETQKVTLKPAPLLSCNRVTDKNPLTEEKNFDLSETELSEVSFL